MNQQTLEKEIERLTGELTVCPCHGTDGPANQSCCRCEARLVLRESYSLMLADLRVAGEYGNKNHIWPSI